MNLERYKELSQQMYLLTKGECDKGCRSKHGCCSVNNCLMAKEVAKSLNINLPEMIGNMYLSEAGCILEPWQRPVCTIHVCGIANLGTLGDYFKDEQYFRLREEMSLELETI